MSDLFVESFDLHDDVAQKEVERNRGKVLVAHDQGVILGAVSWQIVPLGARAAFEITFLAVAHGARGRGIGKDLVSQQSGTYDPGGVSIVKLI